MVLVQVLSTHVYAGRDEQSTNKIGKSMLAL